MLAVVEDGEEGKPMSDGDKLNEVVLNDDYDDVMKMCFHP
jgi:hypothetical protein